MAGHVVRYGDGNGNGSLRTSLVFRPAMERPYHRIKALGRDELHAFAAENLGHLLEDETLAILANPHCTPLLCGALAQIPRLTAFYSVRLHLVAHRATPQAHATKLVHYLHWADLVRLSVDVTVPAPVRRAIDKHLLLNVERLTLGEKIASAKRCSAALIKALLFDPNPLVLAALLVNPRLREDDVLLLASSSRATAAQLTLVGSDRRWSLRYAVRKALVLNPSTPRATAAAQLAFLRSHDLRQIHRKPETSVYLRRCIERLRPESL
jgi:hypothetical protein